LLDDISEVSVAAAIAKRTFSIARQSIILGIVISIGLMAAYATGRFSPLSGAILQEVVDVIVIFNALRAHGGFKSE
jgi:cation transport ATPase